MEKYQSPHDIKIVAAVFWVSNECLAESKQTAGVNVRKCIELCQKLLKIEVLDDKRERISRISPIVTLRVGGGVKKNPRIRP